MFLSFLIKVTLIGWVNIQVPNKKTKKIGKAAGSVDSIRKRVKTSTTAKGTLSTL